MFGLQLLHTALSGRLGTISTVSSLEPPTVYLDARTFSDAYCACNAATSLEAPDQADQSLAEQEHALQHVSQLPRS